MVDEIQVRQDALKIANELSFLLTTHWPPVPCDPDFPGGVGAIPAEGVEPIAGILTSVIAEVIQGWLNAGSEREVTDEELYPIIHDHLKGWSTEP